MATVGELLRAAASGHLGVDRRLIQTILDEPDAAAEVLAFSREPREVQRLDLDPLIIDLFRYWKSDTALDFYIDAVRRQPEEIGDDLVQAFLPFGEKAAEPLLKLYEELGEEQGGDVAFLLAGLRVRDRRVLALLLDRLEYDAGDGAFLLGLYGDQAARPALEKMLAEIPRDEAELRLEIERSLELLDSPEPKYEPESFDILKEYPKTELPAFDLLPDSERIEMLSSDDPLIRAGAAHSFFNEDLEPRTREKLFELAKDDPELKVRVQAWESLSGAAEQATIQSALMAALTDESKPVEERGAAAVGLYAFADKDDARRGIEALYELGGHARAKALEAMWRSLWEPYAKYFAQHLEETEEIAILRQALRGAGYFRLTRCAEKIASYLDREGDLATLREDALFAYALAMPGETTRGRIRGMLRKIDELAELDQTETDLVMFALDERLRLTGLAPVFAEEEARSQSGTDAYNAEPEARISESEEAPAAAASPKIGRNDPCPCGSGKKFKKCCGA
ncbi:MAG TPA: SEC-C metal-binding domain-containing protein [Bryobacteraceae bacterium]|nr:SEC-C metal-binding domain-containing protein [Bryobacteraceae bacterium]